MHDCELISFITAVACTIIKCFPDEELELISAAFVQLGDTLATYLVQQSMKENKCQSKLNDCN
ncbi:hypothetical protein DFR55_12534 [Herbinix hemicellulosilytica]|uniref:DUF6774 domain-containing protein n=1 Tax=Herbinix hemicellulosilytica TaxID=1564487 RepID=A0A0H5SIY0_HERHM|nr:DUF6774 domain-containing protein [Herbinix hemicellulosilytica]RBP57311.1 hypothetical protein DFR55_12534 [Herbinix hemicellulosilytica]CRZ34771.1 hypothetical protein HHT355_1570 [Herbinix hemicellulosilytica]